jgi:hypothetical protein
MAYLVRFGLVSMVYRNIIVLLFGAQRGRSSTDNNHSELLCCSSSMYRLLVTLSVVSKIELRYDFFYYQPSSIPYYPTLREERTTKAS